MKPVKNLVSIVFLFCFFSASSCKKESSTPTGTAPSNLVVNAVVSSDGTGKVNFTATATNAVTYDYEFGNGAIASAPTGITEYRYTLAGNNTYTVRVTAKSSAGLTTSKTITVTVNVTVTAPVLVWSDEFKIGRAHV